MNEPDGVACEPGSVIKQSDGTLWVCDDLGWKYHLAPPAKVDPRMDMPNCDPGELLAWNHKLQTFECISDDPLAAVTWDGTPNLTVARAIDPFWIIAIGLAVTIFGVVGMGLSQWWRNRKAQPKEVVPEINWESLLRPVSNVTNELGVQMRQPENMVVYSAGMAEPTIVPLTQVKKEATVAEPIDKNPNSLQDEIKEIYMEIQLGRGELNKIPGFVQICVNSGMTHLNKARDMVAALGGKVGK